MRIQLSTLLLAATLSAFAADETVTIPKSRLEALEKKEAELERLRKAAEGVRPEPAAEPKGAIPPQPSPAATPAVGAAATGKIIVIPPPQKEVTLEYPSVETLPPLKRGESVDAGMLAAQFKMEPAGAAKRYARQRFVVNGTISGFDRPLVARNFKVVLRPAGVELPIICDFYPPDKYKAVFTTDGGSTLIGTLQNEARITLARVGQPVAIEGECRGASGKSVRFVGSRFTDANTGL